MKNAPSEPSKAPQGPYKASLINQYGWNFFSYILKSKEAPSFKPEEALSFMSNECDNVPPEFDWYMEGRGETEESMSEVSELAVRRLKIMAQKGNSDAIRALVHLTYSTILFLNALADGRGAGTNALKKIASKAAEWPQLTGKHPDVVKESQERMKKIGLGARVKMKTGASNRPIKKKEYSHIIGGYASRLHEVIRLVRDDAIYWRNQELSEEKLIPWIREALALKENKSDWCSFALKSLKEMNGGNYPEDFLKRGDSQARFYKETALLKKDSDRSHAAFYSPAVKGMKNQGVIGAEKAFRKSWEARF